MTVQPERKPGARDGGTHTRPRVSKSPSCFDIRRPFPRSRAFYLSLGPSHLSTIFTDILDGWRQKRLIKGQFLENQCDFLHKIAHNWRDGAEILRNGRDTPPQRIACKLEFGHRHVGLCHWCCRARRLIPPPGSGSVCRNASVVAAWIG